VVEGVPVFGNGLEAHVTRDGRLVALQGAPVAGVTRVAARAGTDAHVSAGEARAAAAQDVAGQAADVPQLRESDAVAWSNGDRAERVWFLTPRGLRLAWATYVHAGGDLRYQHVIDASDGSVLYRHDTVSFARGDAPVFENYPGAPRGGQQHVVNLARRGMLHPDARFLSGPTAIAWADIDADNLQDPNERVPVPRTETLDDYLLQPFGEASALCSPSFLCTWDHNVARSWQRNLSADVLQGFYSNSRFAAYLRRAPFGFTPQAGGFRGDDPVLLHALDGADTAAGFPDALHVNNANMATPPDGIPPVMQMFLFRTPGSTDEQQPRLPASSSFDPSVIQHEYVHGLSNRLVVDAGGNSTIASVQAGAMGEGWSDYYAMDHLAHQGLQPDTAAPGEMLLGRYLKAGVDAEFLRTMPVDCPVGTTSERCTDIAGQPGGYTYGEFSGVIGIPEVHASGEIWAQTLWDLRNRLGHDVTGMLVTRAMELSPADPSFLDMRNAILQADLAAYGGDHRRAIWRTFATRGMGFFAGTFDSSDPFPAEDFSMPPSPTAPRGILTGLVTDQATGDPVAGAMVAITGHSSGFTGDYVDVTDALGRYTIASVFAGTYPSVAVLAPGYERLESTITVAPPGIRADFAPRRNWAAGEGGSAVASFNGPDLTAFGCGPSAAFDLSQGTGWGSTTGDDLGTPTNVMVPKFVVVELPATVSVSGFAVDPSHVCGDPGSSSTGDYRIETSPDGTTWNVADEGTFTVANRYRYNEIAPDAPISGVRFVRFTMLSPQVPDFGTNCPDGAFGGCRFTDMSELQVFGTAE
jgi:hypothetical protein